MPRLSVDTAPAKASMQVSHALKNQGANVTRVRNRVYVRPRRNVSLELEPPPRASNWKSVVVKVVGLRSYTVSFGGLGWERLGSLDIEVAQDQHPEIDLRDGAFSLRVTGKGSYWSAVTIRNLKVWYLACINVEIHLLEDSSVVNSATFFSSSLRCVTGVFRSAQGLGLLGSTSISGSVETDWLDAADDQILELAEGSSVTTRGLRIHGTSNRTPKMIIKGAGQLSVYEVGESGLWLFDSAVLVIRGEGRSLDIRGDDRDGEKRPCEVRIEGRLVDSRMSNVRLDVQGSVDTCSGWTRSLSCTPRATVSAGTRRANAGSSVESLASLTPKSITKATDADLSGIDVSKCRIADLTALGSVSRLSIWLPGTTKESIELANGMDHLTPSQRSMFWTRLASIAGSKHAPGAQQSELRYVASEMRLRSTTGREHAWLRLYKTIGYGERILLPLLWFAVIVGVVSALITAAAGWESSYITEWLSRSWRLAFTPLAFFRLDSLGINFVEQNTWAHVLVLAVQGLGIVLLLMSLLAIRRIVRAT